MLPSFIHSFIHSLIRSIVACASYAGDGGATSALVPVCHCELFEAENAECPKCGKGFNQEIFQGRPPRFASRYSVVIKLSTVSNKNDLN